MSDSGLFIVFEGGEGAGKTTQVGLLAETLRAARPGHEVVVTAEPGSTRLGAQLRKLLLHDDGDPMDTRAETLLYLADRADHIARIIRPALRRGATVVCDRFNDSTLIYQGHARGLGQGRLEELTKWVLEGTVPDMVIVLDIDPQVGLARVAARGDGNRFDAETLTFHDSVRGGFLRRVDKMQMQRASSFNSRTDRTPRYGLVDGSADATAVAAHVREYVQDLIVDRAGDAR